MFQNLALKTIVTIKNRQAGLTTVEYAVAGGLIAAAVVAAFVALGGTVGGVIVGINGELT